LVSEDTSSTRVGWRMATAVAYGIAGAILLVFSLFHFIQVMYDGSELLKILRVPSDPMVGIVMLISSALMLMSSYRTLGSHEDGWAYSVVGWCIGALIPLISLLVLFSDLFRSMVLGSDDLSDWVIMDDIVPSLYIGILIIILLPILVKHRRKEGKKIVVSGGEPL